MEPVLGVSGSSVADRIAETIRARITSGNLKPGDPLPTVNEIAEQWHCAWGTAQAALAQLKREGLVTGGRGKPATVRQRTRRTPIMLSPEWTQQQKDAVLKPRNERAKIGAIELTTGVSIDDTASSYRYSTVPSDDELSGEFGFDVGTPLLRRMYESADPRTGLLIAWSVSYIPKHLIESNPALLDETEEPWPGGHQHQLYTVGIELAMIERTIIAEEPTPAERQRWGIETGGAILSIREKSIDIDKRVVELSDARYPADRTQVMLTEHLRRWPKGYPKYDPAADGDA